MTSSGARPAARPQPRWREASQPWPPPASTLAHGLEQDDGRGRRNIETAHVTRHGNGGHEIAPLAHQSPKTVAFGAHDERGRYRQIQLIVRRFRRRRPAPRSRRPLLQLFEGARDVDDVGDRHMMHRAGRRLGRRAVERRRAPRLPHHARRAGRIDRPQDRADVLRILDAVEHDDQRRIAARRRARSASVASGSAAHVGDDALVHAVARVASSASRVTCARPRTPRAAASSSSAAAARRRGRRRGFARRGRRAALRRRR